MSRKRNYTFDGHPIFLLGERETESYGKMKVQDFYALRKEYSERKLLFEDDEFPARSESQFYSRKDDKTYKWLRPNQICQHPKFFVEGYSRFDVQQGELSDCWFLAAAANLTLNQHLFSRVVCDDNSFSENYAGIFHFRFWRYGKWVDVVIDDRLPTFNGNLVYGTSNAKNEFWIALLEKAYAKLNGNYESLIGGQASEALEDFTGGISERIDIKKAPENLFEILRKAFQRNSLVGCSIESKADEFMAKTSDGLIKGHAYSVTGAEYIDISTKNKSGKIPLVRLRNPWGDDFEWNGAWSDKSREWSLIPDYKKDEIQLKFNNDGEFWMSYKDFLKNFDHLEICYLSPGSFTDDENMLSSWKIDIFEGEWITGISSGGCNDRGKFHFNPQYVMELTHPDDESDDGKCSAVVALMQKNRRNKKKDGLKMLTIGFKIFQLSKDDLEQKPLKAEFFKSNTSIAISTFINLRSVSFQLRLLPGHYLIVPATFEAENGEFLIRVFSNNKNALEEHDMELGSGNIDARVKETIRDLEMYKNQFDVFEQLFNLLSGGPDKEIGWVELQAIFNLVFGNGRQNQSLRIKRYFKRFFSNYVCTKKSELSDFKSINMMNEKLELDVKVMRTQNQDIIQGFSKDLCRSLIGLLDFDRSGKLGLEEFKNLIQEIYIWKNVFKLYDKDQNNKLDSYELRDALESAGYLLNSHILGSLLYRYGSPDNIMTLDDFIMCAIKVKTMVNRFHEKQVNSKNHATFTIDEWITSTTCS